MRVWNEAYVILGITDEDSQRNTLVGRSKAQQTPAILHHHPSTVGCNNARKACETYRNGERVAHL